MITALRFIGSQPVIFCAIESCKSCKPGIATLKVAIVEIGLKAAWRAGLQQLQTCKFATLQNAPFLQLFKTLKRPAGAACSEVAKVAKKHPPLKGRGIRIPPPHRAKGRARGKYLVCE